MSSSNAKCHAEYFRKKGYSLREIASVTNVSKSTLSVWLRGVPIDSEGERRMKNRLDFLIKRRSGNNYKDRKNREYETRNKAKIIVDSLDSASLGQTKLLCALLYYCEGSKSSNEGISFTNSDPALIRTFMRLFRESFKLEENKFRLCLYTHDYHSETKQNKFWSKITRIPPEKFSKSYVKKFSKIYKKANYQGSLRIRYGDANVARELLEVARFYFQRVK